MPEVGVEQDRGKSGSPETASHETSQHTAIVPQVDAKHRTETTHAVEAKYRTQANHLAETTHKTVQKLHLAHHKHMQCCPQFIGHKPD